MMQYLDSNLNKHKFILKLHIHLFNMLFKAIMAQFLLMGKLDVEKLTQWLAVLTIINYKV